MNVAVLGYGNIAKRHIDNLQRLRPDAALLVLRGRRAPLETRHKSIPVTTDFEDLVAFAPVCAIVASPASEHVRQALRLAEGGAHLLVEKPLSHTMEGVDELVSLCEDRGLVLMTAYDMAYLPSLRSFTEKVTTGSGIGRLLSLHATVGQYLPDWRKHIDYRQSVSARKALGGGALLELSHEIEYVYRLLGGVRSVYCTARRSGLLEIDVEDQADLLLEGQNGAVATIHMNMLQTPPYRQCRAVGTEGMLSLDFSSGITSRRSPGSNGWTDCEDAHGRGASDMLMDELREFFLCQAGGALPTVSGRRGGEILAVVLAAKKSSMEGRRIEL